MALLAFGGAWFSATQIVSVNSYTVTPTGIHPRIQSPHRSVALLARITKLDLYIPTNLVPLLNVTTLTKLGMTVSEATTDSVKVEMPGRIVQQLAFEA